MVIDQGTMLDRIDYNVERMATDVKEADKELKVATTYQKKSTKRKIILLLILLVVAMVILVTLKPKGRREPASTPPPLADSAPLADPNPPIFPPPRLRRDWLADGIPRIKMDWRRRKRSLATSWASVI